MGKGEESTFQYWVGLEEGLFDRLGLLAALAHCSDELHDDLECQEVNFSLVM